MSLEFEIKYIAEFNGTRSNESVTFIVKEDTGYEGDCTENYQVLTVDYKDGWSLELNYTLEQKAYFELSTLVFKYVVDAENFPNVVKSELGPKSVTLANQSLFSANKGNSYKCFSESDIKMNEDVNLRVTHYQAQPFSEGKTGFDTAIECPADTTGTSKLVPIIVGSALAILVIMVLVAYIIGRRKHRPGYQQV